jgi:hypothetical protein
LLVQMAKTIGARVIATAAHRRKRNSRAMQALTNVSSTPKQILRLKRNG